ncbi:MAG: FAD-binding oxidoreductase [Hyphomicrobiaceae bacterium]|nr:FAD-binding oxidoreductase [Hyphomicrobiaceae bacterium]
MNVQFSQTSGEAHATPVAGVGRPRTFASSEPRMTSYWHDEAGHDGTARRASVLPESATFAVIGGGLAGLSTAINLKRRAPEASVVVVEARHVGYGASGRNGGLMSPLPAPAWLMTAAHDTASADAVRALNREVASAAHWLARTLPDSEARRVTLDLEARGRLTDAGVGRVARILAGAGIDHELRPGPRLGGPRTLQLEAHSVHPFRLVRALARHAEEQGVEIVEGAAVAAITPCEAGAEVRLADGRAVTAHRVIVATNAYTNSLEGSVTAKAKALHNYMLATKPLPGNVLAALGASGTFRVELNTAYVFYRVHAGRLIFGGIEKLGDGGAGEFGVPAAVLAGLRRHLATTLAQRGVPTGGDVELDLAWGGKFHQTANDLPIIGPAASSPAIVLNVGYGGTGVALSLVCARLAAAAALDGRYESEADRRCAESITATRTPVVPALRFGASVALSAVARACGLER